MATRLERGRDGAPSVEDVEARAARLGITEDRILEELKHIAFADPRRIAEWKSGEEGLWVMPSKHLEPADAAAIAEIVASAATGRIYRIKWHDKNAAISTLARIMHMLGPVKTVAGDDGPTEEEAESARQRLIAAIDRLTGRGRGETTGSGSTCS